MTAAGQWLVRAVLAAGVVGIAAVHFDDQARTDPIELLLGRAATALRVAGFAVERHREGWAGTRAAGRRSLLARHPACAQPIVVEAMGALNPRRDDRLAYFYGDASGAPPGLVTFAVNALAMAWNHALPWRESPRPSIKMLAVTDPSACLVITAVEWRRVWFGPDRPGAIHPHERSIP
jgi:hypothetical protein